MEKHITNKASSNSTTDKTPLKHSKPKTITKKIGQKGKSNITLEQEYSLKPDKQVVQKKESYHLDLQDDLKHDSTSQEDQEQKLVEEENLLKQNSSQKRHDNSLSILTRRFMKLIRSQPTLTVDLNQASVMLGVQKRRIYDITNVLEGINYVTKVSKNKLQWIGPYQQEARDYRMQEMERLLVEEMLLNKVASQLKDKISNLKRRHERQCYLTVEDIQKLGSMQTQQEKSIVIEVPKSSNIYIGEYHTNQKTPQPQINKNKNPTKFQRIRTLCIDTFNKAKITKEGKKKTPEQQTKDEIRKIKVFSMNQISKVGREEIIVKKEEPES